jgi:hypothetical protein
MNCDDVSGRCSDRMCRLRISRAVSNCPVMSFCREALECLLLAIYFCIRVLIIHLFIWTCFCLFVFLPVTQDVRIGEGAFDLIREAVSGRHDVSNAVIHMSWVSSVSIMSRPHIKRLVFDSLRRQRVFHFDCASRPGVKPTQPLCEDTGRPSPRG